MFNQHGIFKRSNQKKQRQKLYKHLKELVLPQELYPLMDMLPNNIIIACINRLLLKREFDDIAFYVDNDMLATEEWPNEEDGSVIIPHHMISSYLSFFAREIPREILQRFLRKISLFGLQELIFTCGIAYQEGSKFLLDIIQEMLRKEGVFLDNEIGQFSSYFLTLIKIWEHRQIQLAAEKNREKFFFIKDEITLTSKNLLRRKIKNLTDTEKFVYFGTDSEMITKVLFWNQLPLYAFSYLRCYTEYVINKALSDRQNQALLRKIEENPLLVASYMKQTVIGLRTNHGLYSDVALPAILKNVSESMEHIRNLAVIKSKSPQYSRDSVIVLIFDDSEIREELRYNARLTSSIRNKEGFAIYHIPKAETAKLEYKLRHYVEYEQQRFGVCNTTGDGFCGYGGSANKIYFHAPLLAHVLRCTGQTSIDNIPVSMLGRWFRRFCLQSPGFEENVFPYTTILFDTDHICAPSQLLIAAAEMCSLNDDKENILFRSISMPIMGRQYCLPKISFSLERLLKEPNNNSGFRRWRTHRASSSGHPSSGTNTQLFIAEFSPSGIEEIPRAGLIHDSSYTGLIHHCEFPVSKSDIMCSKYSFLMSRIGHLIDYALPAKLKRDLMPSNLFPWRVTRTTLKSRHQFFSELTFNDVFKFSFIQRLFNLLFNYKSFILQTDQVAPFSYLRKVLDLFFDLDAELDEILPGLENITNDDRESIVTIVEILKQKQAKVKDIFEYLESLYREIVLVYTATTSGTKLSINFTWSKEEHRQASKLIDFVCTPGFDLLPLVQKCLRRYGSYHEAPYVHDFAQTIRLYGANLMEKLSKRLINTPACNLTHEYYFYKRQLRTFGQNDYLKHWLAISAMDRRNKRLSYSLFSNLFNSKATDIWLERNFYSFVYKELIKRGSVLDEKELCTNFIDLLARIRSQHIDDFRGRGEERMIRFLFLCKEPEEFCEYIALVSSKNTLSDKIADVEPRSTKMLLFRELIQASETGGTIASASKRIKRVH